MTNQQVGRTSGLKRGRQQKPSGALSKSTEALSKQCSGVQAICLELLRRATADLKRGCDFTHRRSRGSSRAQAALSWRSDNMLFRRPAIGGQTYLVRFHGYNGFGRIFEAEITHIPGRESQYKVIAKIDGGAGYGILVFGFIVWTPGYYGFEDVSFNVVDNFIQALRRSDQRPQPTEVSDLSKPSSAS